MTDKKTVEIEESIQEEVEVVDEALQELLASFTPDNFTLGQGTYRLVKNYRDGFDYEATIKRYNDVLEKYDFIVGDWGYDQLRLKGFFLDDFRSAPIDAKISTLEDYLYEYCNFGCAYFVIQQTGEFKRRGRTSYGGPKKNNNYNNKNKNNAHTEEKRYSQNKNNSNNNNNNKKKNNFKSRKTNNQGPKKNQPVNKKVVHEEKKQPCQSKPQFTIRNNVSE